MAMQPAFVPVPLPWLLAGFAIASRIGTCEGQTTSATTTEADPDSNDSSDTYGQTAMIIGVVIAFIVVVVLLASIVWLFWFSPVKDGNDGYDDFDNFHDDVFVDESQYKIEGSPTATPTRNGWIADSPEGHSPGKGSPGGRSRSSRHSSWEEEVAGVHDDIMQRLGITFEVSDEDEDGEVRRQSSRKKTKRKSRASSVKRFSPSKGSVADSDDDDDVVISSRVKASATSTAADPMDDGGSSGDNSGALTPVFRQISSSWREHDDIITGAPRPKPTANRSFVSHGSPASPVVEPPSLETGVHRNRSSIAKTIEIERVAQV